MTAGAGAGSAVKTRHQTKASCSARTSFHCPLAGRWPGVLRGEVDKFKRAAPRQAVGAPCDLARG
jgi:hypothetical protein